MAEVNDKDVFGGFDAIFDTLTGSKPTDLSNKNEYRDPDDIVKDEEEVEEEIVEEEEVVEEVEETEEETEDESEEESEEEEESTVESNESSNEESDIISPFVDLFSKELGWELEDDDKPKSISELVDYMSDIIEANSAPKYASDDIKSLDDYVKAGGNIEQYFRSIYSENDIDNLDMSNESNQKAVVKELLKLKGFSDERIEKKISTYEDAGVLEEESEDAVEILKEEKEKLSKKLLEDQKKLQGEYQKKQQIFVTDVKELIDNTSSVKGLPLSKKDRDSLKEYIFKVDKDGKTQYQKDYSKNYQNLVESAYFTMKGDSLVKGVKTKAESDAVVEFKKKLKSRQNVNRSNNSKNYESGKSDIISAISRALIKPH